MRCGAPLSRLCPTCSAANSLEAHFCLRCGKPLVGAAPTERRVVSVLFADLVGSTRIAQRVDPERMRALIQTHFSAMREEIERYGGVVEKFIGDAVMAVFGLPTAHEDDPERAVRAAMSMQQRMTELNARLSAELHIRIGVSTGEVVADPAAVEAGQSMVTGEVVNLAARLQEQAPADGVLVDERTYETTKLRADYRPLPPAGNGEFATRARWQVVGLTPGRSVPGLHAFLVGRDDELHFLQALYRRVVEGRKQHLVTVIGAAGVGKSRLAEELLRTLGSDAAPPHVLRGRCPAYGEGLTYWPLAEMVKQECAVKDTDPPPTVREKLRTGVLEICEPLFGKEESETISADLAAVLGVELPRPDQALLAGPPRVLPRILAGRSLTYQDQSDGGSRGIDLLAQSVRSFLLAKAHISPLVLVFEDLHWAEESLLDLLEHPGLRGSDAPILTLCLARPELFEQHPEWGARIRNYTALSLSPLPTDLSRLLMTELLRGTVVPEDVSAAILAKAEGIPFFIEEILRMLIENGSLVREGRGWQWASSSLEIRIPDTIHGILASRLDLLTPLEKRVIQDASVPGRIFWSGAVIALSELNAAEVATALGRLQERDLVQERPVSSLAGEREFAFRHALTQEVAYRMLPKAARSIRHLRFAQWVERTAAENVGKFLEVLAHHYEDAWRYQFDAGHNEAELARRAVEALRRAGTRATALRTLPEARRIYERALAILRNAGLDGDVPLHLELLTDHAEVVKWMPDPDSILADTEVVLELAPRIGRDDLVARAWLNRAFAEYDHERLQPAEDALRRALELFRRLHDRQGEAEALEMLGSITSSLRGSLGKAQTAYQEALDLYREMEDGQGLARTTAWLGRVILTMGRLGEANALLTEALQLARTHQERISEAASLMGLAILAHLRGDARQAVSLHHEVIALRQALGDPVSEAVRRHLAMHYLRQGNLAEAERELQLASALRRQHGAKSDSAFILRALAEVYLARGELLTAAGYAERAVADVPEHDAIARATHVATLGMVRAAQGRREDAEELFTQSLAVLENGEYRIDLALALWKYAEALRMLKQSERARRMLERALPLFTDMGATHFVRAIDAELARVRETSRGPGGS